MFGHSFEKYLQIVKFHVGKSIFKNVFLDCVITWLLFCAQPGLSACFFAFLNVSMVSLELFATLTPLIIVTPLTLKL